MKHNLKIISILLGLFLLAQFVGLLVTSSYIQVDDLPLGIERPEVNEKTSFVPIFIFILIATALVFVLLRFKLFRLWKLWFLLSVFFCLTVSFAAFVTDFIAIILGVILAVWKLFKPNVIIHNLTELFIYGALAAIFAPLLGLYSAIILLILISVYDYIAVCKTKHMVEMAQSQEKAKVFAGLLVPYGKNTAILGGGDIGFPLLFSGVVMTHFGLGLFDWQVYLIPIFSGLGLLYLFLWGDGKKFYPAMPFITVGCLIALGLVFLFT
ncbi:hypothetical protein HOC80_04700 [archaeon]|nr:hypothetical protein [archaeon]MBT4417373.1 hypothetical protein [archaeon]